MDCFDLPSFHDGSGSADWAAAVVAIATAQKSAVAVMLGLRVLT